MRISGLIFPFLTVQTHDGVIFQFAALTHFVVLNILTDCAIVCFWKSYSRLYAIKVILCWLINFYFPQVKIRKNVKNIYAT
jgi:hypothetical protein